ncbi:MAG: sigma-54 dependent transcriptional regulator [Bacteroidales bacterium]|jgi:DNA-binding NtrC family response regulator|nr:sigma-54 dependent transcriptional regulator [Bacteroidales bacterium]
MSCILIIDDEKAIRRALKEILEYEKYSVEEAVDGIDGLEKMKANDFDLIFCDIKMPGMDGMELLEKAKEITSSPIVMISGHGNIATAVEALKKGAVDYIEKPLDLNRVLKTVKENINKQIGKPKQEIKQVKQSLSLTNIVGQSKVVKQMIDLIDKVAATDAKILITGDNGTGKELVAKQLYEKSLRKDNPFIELNCAAIPNDLIESELFGHEKGSFTTALNKQRGKFVLADKGTLFLDEIGDMSLTTQSKVLQAIQENKILPIGSEKDIQVDVRIISATNKNLLEQIKQGLFREDLYHRINVIEIKVPALKDRREDIPLLVNHFLNVIALENNTQPKKIEKTAIDYLTTLDYSGNIRQLRNMIERLNILSDSTITLNDIKKYI